MARFSSRPLFSRMELAGDSIYIRSDRSLFRIRSHADLRSR